MIHAEGTRVPCVVRSANALTCKDIVTTTGGERVFVKVGAIDPADNSDRISVDAACSFLVSKVVDPDAEWTAKLVGISFCRVEGATAVILRDRDPRTTHLALSYDVVDGADITGTRSVKTFGQLADRLREFLARYIATSARIGMTHNDMHPGNVMLEPCGTMRLIDYSRVSLNARAYAAHLPGVNSILSIGRDTIDGHAVYMPFARCDPGARMSDVYWTADLVTLSLKLYSMIRKGMLSGVNATKATFLQHVSARGTYDADIDGVDDLAEKADRLTPDLAVLLPGLEIFALMMFHAQRHRGFPAPNNNGLRYLAANFTLESTGGRLLLDMLQSINSAPHLVGAAGVLARAFARAGLPAASLRRYGIDGAAATGGAGGGEIADVDITGLRIFPANMIEAAGWHDAEVRGVDDPAPETDAFPVLPMGIMAGGARAAANAALAAVVVAVAIFRSLN